MVVTDNDVKKLEKHFFSFSFLERNKKKKCGAFKTHAAVPEKQVNMFFGLIILKWFQICIAATAFEKPDK